MRRCIYSLFLVAILFNLLGLVSARAQEGKGTIAGSVKDPANGVLVGALVELQPTGKRAVSDDQGQFRIPDVAPGEYTLTGSYVGFSAFSTTVKVEGGQVATADVAMKVASQNDQVIVTAERVHGEAEAINEERTSENILQVLPAEVITSLPNTNVADALGRLPSVTLERNEGEGKYVQIRGTEPRLTNVTIDGMTIASPEANSRQIKLDIIPADLVQSVEINKTLSANQDGDGIGGSVNLVTKAASERPTISIGGMGGYTPILGGRGLDEFDGTIGRRFGTKKRFGVLLGGSYDWNGRGIDDVEPAPDVHDFGGTIGVQPVYDGIDFREYRYYRTRYGFAGSADYKLGEGSSLYLHVLYAHFDNFGDRWVYSPTINSFASPNQGGTDGQMFFNAQIRRPVQVIGSLSAGAKHVFTKSWLAWDLSVSRSSTDDEGYATSKFGLLSTSPLNNVQFGIDTSDAYRPKLPVLDGKNVYDPTQYYLNEVEVNKTYTPQLNLQGGASFARNYTLGGHPATFEFGGKVRNAHKFQNANDLYYSLNNPSDPALQLSAFQGTFTNSNYYDKSYNLGQTADYSKIASYFDTNPSAFSLKIGKSQDRTAPNNFDLNERVSAGYLTNTVDIDRFHFVAGVRFEGTQLNTLGYQVATKSSALVPPVPLPGGGSYTDVLPSAQVRIRLTQNTGVRLVYGRGVSRPDFQDMVQFVTEDQSYTVSRFKIGNPSLKPEHANNFDLLYEQYLKPVGMFEAGYFFKDLSSPIVVAQTTPTSGQFAGHQVSGSINAGSAWVTGFEIAYQQHLGFLPGAMGGLGISANYSYTASRTSGLPGRLDNPALLRQAPNTWNISPTYDRGRFSVRVGLAYNGANIFQYNYSPSGNDSDPIIGLKGPTGDQYLYSHLQVDAQGSIRVAKGFQFIASGLNLTNEVFGFYQGSPIYPIQREFYKPSVIFGMRWSSSAE